jgi:hypothetical protein
MIATGDNHWPMRSLLHHKHLPRDWPHGPASASAQDCDVRVSIAIDSIDLLIRRSYRIVSIVLNLLYTSNTLSYKSNKI